MKYTIKVSEVKRQDGNVRGFATIVFGDSFKITNIAILENKDKEQLFVSMPRFKHNVRDENGKSIYKDVCNPITAEFREELYSNIVEAYESAVAPEPEKAQIQEKFQKTNNSIRMPEFSVVVTPYEKEGSNIRGLARIYFENSFIVNNVNILQGKESVFVSMPAYKTKQNDEEGRPIYQSVCYPVTKKFREKLNDEIIRVYEQSKKISQNQAKKNKDKRPKINEKQREAIPYR